MKAKIQSYNYNVHYYTPIAMTDTLFGSHDIKHQQ